MSQLIYISFLLVISIPLIFCKGSLVHLDEDNWDVMLEGEWMVEFFAPWCPACKSLQPVWSEFASWSDDLSVSVAAVDITSSPGLSGRFMITALPSIFHVKDGVFRQYRGSRGRDEFISFIEERKWTDIEPVSQWRSPTSVQMSLLSHFFKLSTILRNLHLTLTEKHGVPAWASYMLFVGATVLIGALLGLVFVCCIDLFCGQKSPTVVMPVDPSHLATGDSGKTDSQDDDDDDDEVKSDVASQRDDEDDDAPSPSSATSQVRKRRTRRAD